MIATKNSKIENIMPIASENEKQTWIDAIYEKLQEHTQNNELDFVISYTDATKAFPVEPSSNCFENTLNISMLTTWATSQGWYAQITSDCVDQQGRPSVRFSRQGK